MRIRKRIAIGISIVIVGWFGAAHAAKVSGDLKVWQAVTISFDGPKTSETADPNPFLDYRLEVTFRKGDKVFTVCGYYAADGNAGQTSAAEGNQWRVHFVPDEAGQWEYTASFRKGKNVAIAEDAKAGEGTAFDGEKGSITIAAADANAPGFLSKGFLRDSGKGYLQARRIFWAMPTSTEPSIPRDSIARAKPRARSSFTIMAPTKKTGGPATRPGRTARARE
jgi:hypothetical protein